MLLLSAGKFFQRAPPALKRNLAQHIAIQIPHRAVLRFHGKTEDRQQNDHARSQHCRRKSSELPVLCQHCTVGWSKRHGRLFHDTQGGVGEKIL